MKEEQSMGERIAALRKERGLTQRELAEQMHVTDKAVFKWERDLACPDIHSLSRLADILSVSVEDLLKSAAVKQAAPSSRQQIFHLVLKAIPLAMGVAVMVTSLLRQLEPTSAICMLGLGMVCLGLGQLEKL